MYNQRLPLSGKHNSPFRGRNSGGFRGGRNSRGGRRPRIFDPSEVIRSSQTQTVVVEEVEFVAKNQFGDFRLSPKLKDNISRRGYLSPTPIQDQAIPEIIAGRDVIGIANTGTGKTGAFLIPLIDKVITSNIKVIIIAPTRELAVQIDKELYSLTNSLGVFSTVCIGGAPMGKQIYHLAKHPDFVIGTPGRLLDLYEQRCIEFSDYEIVVLDEVDRMLDMGFLPDVERIVSNLPTPRQSLFFSATVTDKVRVVMSKFVKDPITISVKTQDNIVNIRQEAVRIEGSEKLRTLVNMLDTEEFQKVLVFGRTKRGVEALNRQLSDAGFRAASIHGNKTQNQRQRALDDFKFGKVNILLATDLASRGLDIDDISHVINYELPETYEDYIHRIGRTGRANKNGAAITFV